MVKRVDTGSYLESTGLVEFQRVYVKVKGLVDSLNEVGDSKRDSQLNVELKMFGYLLVVLEFMWDSRDSDDSMEEFSLDVFANVVSMLVSAEVSGNDLGVLRIDRGFDGISWYGDELCARVYRL